MNIQKQEKLDEKIKFLLKSVKKETQFGWEIAFSPDELREFVKTTIVAANMDSSFIKAVEESE